jgi:FkbM family methyltransferase
MQIEQKEIFGAKFAVVVPASIGLPRHDTSEFDAHEPCMEGWVADIRPGDVVIDAGASFGNYTLAAIAKGARAVCYEPYEECARILRTNLTVNGWEDLAVIREVGLWWEGSEPYPQGILAQLGVPLDMPTVCLDNEMAVLALADLPATNRVHIKIDTEGTELGIIKGALKLIAKYHPKIVIEDHENVNPDPSCEVSHYPERVESRKNINAILSGLGYKLEVLPFDVSRHYIVAT